jgi:Flp pilus assembly protein TadG
VLLLLVSVLVYGGRVAIAGQAVQQAADEAAREATIARTPASAHDLAIKAAMQSLSEQHFNCQQVTVDVDVSGFAQPAGVPATVTAEVTCVLKVGDLAIPGLPGHKILQADSLSPLDTYRSRQ